MGAATTSGERGVTMCDNTYHRFHRNNVSLASFVPDSFEFQHEYVQDKFLHQVWSLFVRNTTAEDKQYDNEKMILRIQDDSSGILVEHSGERCYVSEAHAYTCYGGSHRYYGFSTPGGPEPTAASCAAPELNGVAEPSAPAEAFSAMAGWFTSKQPLTKANRAKTPPAVTTH